MRWQYGALLMTRMAIRGRIQDGRDETRLARHGWMFSGQLGLLVLLELPSTLFSHQETIALSQLPIQPLRIAIQASDVWTSPSKKSCRDFVR